MRIRNLTFDGAFGSGVGIDFNNGATLFVENCVFQNFNSVSATAIRFRPANVVAKLNVSDTTISNNGTAAIGGGILANSAARGIRVNPASGTSALSVTDSIFEHNGQNISGGGIFIEPTGTGSIRAVIEHSRFAKNTHGIVADGTQTTGSIIVQVRDSVVSGSSGNGIWALSQSGKAPTGIVVDHTSSVGNAGSGVLAQGAGALVHLSASTVVGNGAGLGSPSGGQIFSYGDNRTKGNGIDGAPTGVLTLN